jgi:hypothetical protein
MMIRDDADAILDSRRAELAVDARRSVAGFGRDLLAAAKACARNAPKRAVATAGILGIGLGVAGPRLFRSFRAAIRAVAPAILPLMRVGWRFARSVSRDERSRAATDRI